MNTVSTRRRVSRVIRLFAIAIIPLGAVGHANAESFRMSCGGFHFIRSGLELGTTAISFRNIDPQHPATIQRLTVRGFSGVILHDSGPAVGVPHPLNFDIPGGQDVTVVPPGAHYYLGTNHIWGNGYVENNPALNHEGFSLSVAVEYSKAGNPELLVVSRSLRVRQQPFAGGPQGNELSRDSGTCVAVDR